MCRLHGTGLHKQFIIKMLILYCLRLQRYTVFFRYTILIKKINTIYCQTIQETIHIIKSKTQTKYKQPYTQHNNKTRKDEKNNE